MVEKYIQFLSCRVLKLQIWNTCIYFQFHLILVVNVDRVYILRQSKDFEKNLNCQYIGQSVECVAPQKNERQQRKPVIDGIRNKKKQEQEVQNTL